MRAAERPADGLLPAGDAAAGRRAAGRDMLAPNVNPAWPAARSSRGGVRIGLGYVKGVGKAAEDRGRARPRGRSPMPATWCGGRPSAATSSRSWCGRARSTASASTGEAAVGDPPAPRAGAGPRIDVVSDPPAPRPRGAARLLRDHGQDARRGGRAGRRPPRSSRWCGTRSGSTSLEGLRAVDVGLLGGVHRRRAGAGRGDAPAGSTSTSRGSRRPGRASASGSTSGWPAARTCPSTTTRSTSRCSTTSTSTSSTPRRSSPTSTGCCVPGGCSTSASGTAGRSSSRTTGCPSCRGCPRGAADRYLRLTGKGDHYYERYYTPAGLRRLFAAYDVWDYTLPVLADPQAFSAGDNVPEPGPRRCRRAAFRAALPLVPTYVWAAFKGPATPAGPALRVPPRHLG